MSRKTQHKRFEDKILRKFANEDKLCRPARCSEMFWDGSWCSNMVQTAQRWSKVLWDGPWCSDMVHATEPWPWAVQVSEVRCGARDAASERVRPVYRAGQTPPQLNTVTLAWHPFPELLMRKTRFWREDCYNASESIHISVDGGISILTADQFVFFTVSILICLTSITNSFPKTSMSLIQSSLIYI